MKGSKMSCNQSNMLTTCGMVFLGILLVFALLKQNGGAEYRKGKRRHHLRGRGRWPSWSCRRYVAALPNTMRPKFDDMRERKNIFNNLSQGHFIGEDAMAVNKEICNDGALKGVDSCKSFCNYVTSGYGMQR